MSSREYLYPHHSVKRNREKRKKRKRIKRLTYLIGAVLLCCVMLRGVWLFADDTWNISGKVRAGADWYEPLVGVYVEGGVQGGEAQGGVVQNDVRQDDVMPNDGISQNGMLSNDDMSQNGMPSNDDMSQNNTLQNDDISQNGTLQYDGMSQTDVPVDDGGQQYAMSNTIDLSGLYSQYAVLVDSETGEVLAERRKDETMYPASLTKIMTAVLAMEKADNLDEVIAVPEEIFPQLYAEEASMAGFLPGEEATVRDLLYGVLLPSGAECCLTLAIHFAGTEEAFVRQMNKKAAELGMTNTNFCNSTGLHDRRHYTTAADLAKLLQYALKNNVFREIFTSSYYYVQPDNLHPDGFVFNSTMYQSMDENALECGILGGKTGYTEEAGLCLASLAQIGGREYILVTAGAPGSHETEPYHILDATYVYEKITHIAF